jgi:hypothetical protein
MTRGVRNARIALCIALALCPVLFVVALAEGKIATALGLLPVPLLLVGLIRECRPGVEHRALSRKEIAVPLLIFGSPLILVALLLIARVAL